MSTTLEALTEVWEERARQDSKWGEQNHPDGTGRFTAPLRGIIRHSGGAIAYTLAAEAKASTDRKAADKTVTWADILLEEVFEALAERDPAELRAELLQVAAVAVQWVEAIDRRPDVQEVGQA